MNKYTANNYAQYTHKLISELDLFYYYFKKPIIAITGTIGKTTTTTLISTLLTLAGYRVALGGNIGVGLADFLHNSQLYDVAVIEVSSYQLEFCTLFAPSIAVWTNFFPNHLDEHGSEESYFNAKTRISSAQSQDDLLITCKEVAEKLPSTIKSSLILINKNTPAYQIPASFKGHPENLLYAYAAVHAFDAHINLATIKLPEVTIAHRMEHLGSWHGVHFINDSKSTVAQATHAALHAVKQSPVILFLGGLSKGVDRSWFFSSLPGHIKHIACFGAEAPALHALCMQQRISSSCHISLEDAFAHCLRLTQEGDTCLFSPGGSSFDLFKNYEERGERFKKLVQALHS